MANRSPTRRGFLAAAGAAATALLARPTVARGLWPSPRLAVADEATVVVSTAEADPLPLGHREPVTGKIGRRIHVWDWSKGEKSRVLAAETGGGFAVAPDGTALATHPGWEEFLDAGKAAKRWRGKRIDLATGAEAPLTVGGGQPVYKLVYSPNGKWLVAVVEEAPNKYRAEIAHAESGERRCALPEPWFGMFAAAFTPNARQVVLMGADRKLRLCDAGSGAVVREFERPHANSLGGLAISPDGRWLLSAGAEGETFLHEMATGRFRRDLAVGQPGQPSSLRRAYSVAFSPDGKWAAGGGVQNLTLWKVEDGSTVHAFGNESGGAVHVRFSADGKELTAVHGFHIEGKPDGGELQVWPRVQRFANPQA